MGTIIRVCSLSLTQHPVSKLCSDYTGKSRQQTLSLTTQGAATLARPELRGTRSGIMWREVRPKAMFGCPVVHAVASSQRRIHASRSSVPSLRMSSTLS